jgi:hypothetical protein
MVSGMRWDGSSPNRTCLRTPGSSCVAGFPRRPAPQAATAAHLGPLRSLPALRRYPRVPVTASRVTTVAGDPALIEISLIPNRWHFAFNARGLPTTRRLSAHRSSAHRPRRPPGSPASIRAAWCPTPAGRRGRLGHPRWQGHLAGRPADSRTQVLAAVWAPPDRRRPVQRGGLLRD